MIDKAKKAADLVATVNTHHEPSTIGIVGAEIAMRLGEGVLHGVTGSLAFIYVFIGLIQGVIGFKALRKAVPKSDKPHTKMQMAGMMLGILCITSFCWGIFLIKDFVEETLIE